MLLVLVSLIFSFLFCIKNRKKEYHKVYFNKKQTDTLRGFGCIFIVFSHLCDQILQNGELFDKHIITTYQFNTFIAQIWVGIFLFLSSFCLVKNFYTHGEKYAKKILLFKIPKMYFWLVLTNLIYFFASTDISNFSQTSILKIFGLSLGSNLNKADWFLYEIFFYYFFGAVTYLILFKFKKQDDLPIYLVVFSVLYYFLILLLGRYTEIFIDTYLKGWWCFPLGVLYAIYFERINAILRKYGWILIALSNLVFLYCFAYHIHYYFFEVTLALIDILMINIYFKLNSKYINFIGRSSFYIYIIHCLFCYIFRHMIMPYTFEVYSIVVFACSILSGLAMMYIEKYSIIGCKKIYSKLKQQNKNI